MQSLGPADAPWGCRKPWRPSPFLVSALLGAALLAAAGPVVAQGDSWQEPSSLSIPRRLLAAAAAGGKIYTFGGCGSPCYAPPLHTSTTEERRVEVYDGQSWTIKNRIPAIVFGAAAAAGDDHLIYLFGGYLTGNALWQYNPTSDSWSRKANLPTPRFGLAAVSLRGKIYVLGGSNGTSPSRALEVYDPLANTWQTKAPMPTARVFLGAAALGRKIYAVGGAPDCCGTSVTSVLEIYDTDTDRWTSGAPLPVAQQVSAAAGVEGRIFTFGGFIPGAGVQGATFEYDPATNAWTAKAPMPLARDQAPAVVFGGQVHVLGGSVNCHCQALATHQSYTPDHEPPLKANLEIVKSDGVTQVRCGDPVEYQIEVTNLGPNAVVDAVVRDVFPSKLEDPAWTCSPTTPGARCAPAGSESIDDRVDLPVGGKVHYEVSGTIGDNASGTIENVATVEPPTGIDDPDRSNNRSVDRNSIACPPCATPPRITKTDDRDSVAPGEMPLYRIVVSNDCPTPLTVMVSDNLLASGLDAVRWCRGVGCTPSNAGNLADSVSIPAHGSVTYQATGTVPCPCDPTRIENRACVQAPGQAPICGTDVDRIEPVGADLSVILTGPDVVGRGSEADYQVKIHNAGPCTARDVQLEFPTPAGFVFNSASDPCGNGFPCQIDEPILTGEDFVVTARFKVNEDAACATVPANVHVTSPCDHNGSNDSSSVSSRVECLEITKTDGLATAPPGATLAYTITVTNPDTAESLPVLVMDAFPKELLEPTWCQGADCVPFLPGDLAVQTDLPAGGSTVYRAQGVVSCLFSGILANTATASTIGEPAIQVSATDETLIVPDPGVTGCCEGIEGVFVEGQMIAYTFVLWNGGPEIQNDNPGPEFENVLPPELMLLDVTASRGAATVQPANTARWDGVLFPGENVIIRVKAKINGGTAGTTICNQGTFYFDADGNGTNESIGLTDDPFLPGPADPCCIDIAIGIPALSSVGSVALVLLLCAGALWQLRTPTFSRSWGRRRPRAAPR